MSTINQPSTMNSKEISKINKSELLSSTQKTIEKTDVCKKSKKKNAKKCASCGKKKGLILLKCRCLKLFCSKHLLPENHECQFDYIEYSKKILEERNPKVVNDKVPSI